MGVGITGARRIMDAFEIQSTPGTGTVARMRKNVPAPPRLAAPPGRGAHRRDARAADAVAIAHRRGPGAEPRAPVAPSRSCASARRISTRLNAELQDTNRGVVALYAELDEKAEHLRRADEMKSKFLSNMTHEFQTPLNSILALTRLLLDRVDGELTEEQEKQVKFIREATQDLSELVHDLLDLAKVEAGKVTLRPTVVRHAGAVRRAARLDAAGADQRRRGAAVRERGTTSRRSTRMKARSRRSCATTSPTR